MNKKKLRIVVAESVSGELASALHALLPGETLELTQVSGVSTLIATLEIVKPDLLFLDLALLHPDPLDAVRRVHRSAPEVPLITLADTADKDYAVRSLTLGAADYLLKGSLDAHSLERILGAVLVRNTLGGLADLLRDPLTNLYTRDGFLTLGTRAMEMAKSRSSTMVLLCMRIENLAEVKAQFGPGAVESSLCEVARVLAGSLRRTDILARLGESQFAALAVDAVEPSAPVLRQRLEKRVQMLNRDIGPWGPLELHMSACFWSAEECSTFPDFLDQVEAELRAHPVQFASEISAGKTRT